MIACRPIAVAAAIVLGSCPPLLADGFRTVGAEIPLDPENSWWSTASYDPVTDQYLVLWMKAGAPWLLQGRCIHASTGQIGATFTVGNTIAFGNAVYSSDLQCWLVVFHTDSDIGGDIKCQKVGVNGNIGGAINLAQNPLNQQRPAADYDPVRKRFLVAWTDIQTSASTIRGRFFDQNAATIPGQFELQISDPTPRIQGEATVAYNPATSEFLVAWTDRRNDIYRTNPNENDNNYIDIYGQRVSAVTMQPVGADIQIFSPFVQGQPYVGDGQDVPGILVCNTNPASPLYGTSFLPDQRLLTAFGFVTEGMILDTQGNRYNGMSPFDISYPLRGGYTGGVYSPADDVYITSYLDSDFDLTAKVFSASGQLVTSGKVIAHPDYEENHGSLAIRPSDGQCLQITTLFEHLTTHARPHALIAQRFIRDHTAPAPPTGFTAQPGPRLVRLSWTNPPDADFTATMIRYSTTGFPSGPAAGNLLVDQPNVPGSADTHIHLPLTAGATVYYSAFAHDDTQNYAPGVQASATPSVLGDFDVDGDVDQSDFAHLQGCFSGDATAYPPGCLDADSDRDGDVDPGDFGQFLGCMAGADRPPMPGC